ncbi:hypothetical protein LJR153_007154 [Paenibacillus sp. LjRoot153]|uniref:hypothetical protein n=1 Tax=Paenibacillus sp. LjRoot153 TaxID=3342270 RepID=UPI003ECF0FF3
MSFLSNLFSSKKSQQEAANPLKYEQEREEDAKKWMREQTLDRQRRYQKILDQAPDFFDQLVNIMESVKTGLINQTHLTKTDVYVKLKEALNIYDQILSYKDKEGNSFLQQELYEVIFTVSKQLYEGGKSNEEESEFLYKAELIVWQSLYIINSLHWIKSGDPKYYVVMQEMVVNIDYHKNNKGQEVFMKTGLYFVRELKVSSWVKYREQLSI